jgi:flagellar biosynthetic protein FliR
VEVAVDASWLIAVLVAFARALAWLMVVPPFNNRTVIPSVATIGIAAGLALLVGPTIPAASLPTDTAGLVGSLVVQIVTGVALGFVVNLLLATVTAAGSLLDLAGGLTLPPSVDPLGLDQTPLLGQFYEQVAVVLLFVSGGYLLMVQGFITSFRAPPFTLGSSGRMASIVATDLATFFTSALEIAAPVLAVLFVAQVVLGLLAKSAPQVNVWVLGFPLQIFLALVLAGVGISVLPGYVTHLLTRAVGDGAGLFGR